MIPGKNVLVVSNGSTSHPYQTSSKYTLSALGALGSDIQGRISVQQVFMKVVLVRKTKSLLQIRELPNYGDVLPDSFESLT